MKIKFTYALLVRSCAIIFLYSIALFAFTINCMAQQVNGVFNDFARNEQWGNTEINTVKLETNGSLTLNGYYEGAWKTGFGSNGYFAIPDKFPMFLRLNSNGSVQSTFGNLTGGGSLLTYVNTEAGSSIMDRSFELSGGFFLVAGHYQTGQGFLTKTTVGGSRPTAFNGGQIIMMPSPAFTAKTYIEDWAVTTTVTYTARMEGVLANAQKIVVTAYNNTTGVPVSSFGTNGNTELPVPGFFALEDTLPLKLTRQTDGKLLIAFTQKNTADADDLILYRLKTDGSLDSTFGNNVGTGYANFSVPRPYAVTSLIVNSNGTITMGGYHATNDGSSLVSFRTYNPVTQSISTTIYNTAPNQVAVGTGSKSMAAIPDNMGGVERIVHAVAFPFAPGSYRPFIAVYNPSGGSENINFTPWQYPGAISAEPTDMIRLSNGSFIVVGKMKRQNGTSAGFVLKYNAGGTIDNSFGEQGAFIVNGRREGTPWVDAAQMPDGKYLAIGTAGFLPEDPAKRAILLNRFNADGSKDTNFGTDGTLYAYPSIFNRIVNQLYPLPDGKFLMGGTHINVAGEDPNPGSTPKATIYKMLADGTPDFSFGIYHTGRASFDGATGLAFSEFKVLADSIYMGGNTALSHTGNYKAFLYKFSSDGIPIGAFFASLTRIHTFTISENTGNAFIGGATNGSAKSICKVKRAPVNVAGLPDTSFGTNGLVAIPIVTSTEVTTIREIKIRPGALLVVSDWAQTNSSSAVKGIYFTLISQEGVLDGSFGTGGNKFLQLPGATSIKSEQFKWTEEGNRLLIFGEATVGGIPKGFICKTDLNGDLIPGFGTNGIIWTNTTFDSHLSFDNSDDIIAIKNYGLLGGGTLAKLDVPASLYFTLKHVSWTGAVNNDWFNAANWAENVVPDAFTAVTIGSANCSIGANMAAVAFSVDLSPAATLTLGANSTLTLTSDHP